jgi:Fur family ferric uptake transcriptional regulator
MHAPEPEITIVEPLCAVFRRTLSAAKLKYTPERARILDAVLSLHEPFQADTLLAHLRRRGTPGSKATVYRTIKLLADAGIIQPIPLQTEQAHYILAYGRRSTVVLVRSDTGTVELLDTPEAAALGARLCAQRGLKPEGQRFILYAHA